MDFIGFTYNGKHSFRDLKIYRTSDGSRYNENLTGSFVDQVVDIPGGHGQYYFGTLLKNRTFNISFAFDDLNETGIKKLKQVFSGDGIHDLVFDETPYKAWSAKVTGIPTLSYQVFDQDEERIYKGEGTLQFTCYYPYAHTPNYLWTLNTKNELVFAKLDGKYLKYYDKKIYPNKTEWQEASGLDDDIRTIKGDIDTYMKYTLTIIKTYASDTQCKSLIVYYGYVNSSTYEKKFEVEFYNPISIQANDQFVWDTKTGLVYHLRGDQKTLCPYKGNGIVPLAVGKKVNASYSISARVDVTSLLEYDFLYI